MSIASIDLNLMLVLHVVLSEQNVARAADRLHVTPSAVSNALARLRDALGDPLVTRKGRGIVPTPRAAELAPILARTMHDLELALGARPFDPASCTRTFTLAVADVGQVVWVPRLASAIRRELPRAHLRIVGIDALISLGDLGSSEVDLHVGIPGRGPGLHVDPLLEERNVLVARRRHAAAGKLSRRALGELRHVRVEMVPGKRFGDPFAAAFAEANVPRQIVMTVPSFSAAADVVAATDLVTMLPSSLLAARGRSLRALVTPLPAHTTKYAMSWHERTHADPAARAFRALVRSTIMS
ncbi:MAG: Transcriptional regulator, LysR family [Myxococcales bacterium]|nr:Transcriptional regulator, LysR family [Myxococcales bacterium]